MEKESAQRDRQNLGKPAGHGVLPQSCDSNRMRARLAKGRQREQTSERQGLQ